MFDIKTALAAKSPMSIRKFFFADFWLIEAEGLKCRFY